MKEKNISKIWILLYAAASIAASCFLACFCSVKNSMAYIDLTMYAKMQFPGYIKIFYLEHGEKNWTEQKTVSSKPLQQFKEEKIQLRFFAKEISMFRLDFQQSESSVNEIHDLQLAGSRKLKMKDLELKTIVDTTVQKKNGNTLKFHVGAQDPYVVFQLKKPLKGILEYDPFLFGVFFALTLIFFGGLWLGIKKIWNKVKDWLDVFFSLGIFLILCVPVTKINRAAISQTENRVLAVFPRLITSDGWINTKFGQEFDSYFNDRFRGRDFLLRNYQKLNAKINAFKTKYYLGNAVVEGDDGWYFYCLKNSLRNFQNLDVFTEQEMKDALQRLKKIDTWCKMNGIKFYYFIAPDKNKVYGEYLKAIPKTYPDSRSRAALWVDYVKKNSDIKILYPIEKLKKERNNVLLYYKLDTHWNFMGGYLGYGELMNVIKKDFPELPEFKAVSYLEQKEYNGDLYMLAPNIVKKDRSIYQYPNLPSQFFKDTSLQIPYRLTNPNGKYKVFFMRDSFCNGMLPFFHYSFREIYASWQFALKNEDLIRMINEKTDIVILEHVERNLPTLAKELQSHSAFESNY